MSQSLRWIVTPGQNSTLNCNPGKWFHVEFWLRVIIPRWMWPRVMIPRWAVTRGWGHNPTWNCDPGSQFTVEFRPRVKKLNSDPSTYLLHLKLRLNKVPKFNSVLKIQQLRRVIIQPKTHWIFTSGRYSIWGPNFILQRTSLLKEWHKKQCQ